MSTLLVRPMPEDGECYGGYIARLARANCYKSSLTLSLDVFGRMIHQAYNFPLQKVVELTAIKDQFKSKLWLQSDPTHGYRYRGIPMPKEFVVPGKHFCPQCLVEGSGRKAQWNLGWMPVCLKHGTMLVVSCRKCSASYDRINKKCDCVKSGMDHLTTVDSDVVRFVAGLEEGLVSSEGSKQWRVEMRSMVTEAYLQLRPHVWNRQYADRTHLPKLSKYPLTPRQTLSFYAQLLDEQAA